MLEGHEEEVDKLSAELEVMREVMRDKLEENRARRYNLCIRGFLENITDLQGTATAFFQELAPELPLERLKFDRIHRSVAPKPSEGPPRDVIIKFHYYRTASCTGTAGSLFPRKPPSTLCRPVSGNHCQKAGPETLPPGPAVSKDKI